MLWLDDLRVPVMRKGILFVFVASACDPSVLVGQSDGGIPEATCEARAERCEPQGSSVNVQLNGKAFVVASVAAQRWSDNRAAMVYEGVAIRFSEHSAICDPLSTKPSSSER